MSTTINLKYLSDNNFKYENETISVVNSHLKDDVKIEGFSNLEKINLSGNQIEKLSIHNDSTVNLKNINISKNYFENLDFLADVDKDNITSLWLHDNNLKIDDTVLDLLLSLKNLTQLDISNRLSGTIGRNEIVDEDSPKLAQLKSNIENKGGVFLMGEQQQKVNGSNPLDNSIFDNDADSISIDSDYEIDELKEEMENTDTKSDILKGDENNMVNSIGSIFSAIGSFILAIPAFVLRLWPYLVFSIIFAGLFFARFYILNKSKEGLSKVKNNKNLISNNNKKNNNKPLKSNNNK